MFKGGYQILDLRGYDLTVDIDGYITDAKTKEFLLNFGRNFNEKPVLVIRKESNRTITGFATADYTKTGISLYIGGMSANYGSLSAILIDLPNEEVGFYFEEL